MMDYEIKDGVAVIPEGTTVIEYLYYGHDSITSVAIPKSVMYISSGAFKNCSSLTSIVIPEGVIEIGDEAFWGCTSLKSIVIPEGVKEMLHKFLIWKTNKEATGRYPAYIFYHTDYSSARKEMIKRDMAYSSDEQQIRDILAAEIADNIKKGWEEVL